jgi:hypothetical protein
MLGAIVLTWQLYMLQGIFPQQALNHKCRFILSFIASNSASLMAIAEKLEHYLWQQFIQNKKKLCKVGFSSYLPGNLICFKGFFHDKPSSKSADSSYRS